MHRAMTGFHLDDDGDWVAELSCLHSQHVRHRPPFWNAAWIDDEVQREAHIGQLLDCPLCDRAELPEGLHRVRTTASWDERSVPAALTRAHRVAQGTWGLLEVEAGEVRFQAETNPPLDTRVSSTSPQPIPPGVDHYVEVRAGARFHITFFTR